MDNINVLADINNKVMISIPYEIQNASSIKFILNFRDVKLIFNLK